MINEVIDEIFVKNILRFDVLLYGTQTPKLKLICDKILNFQSAEVRINLINDFNFQMSIYKPTIILTTTPEEAFNMMGKCFLTNLFPNNLKFLMYIEEKFDFNVSLKEFDEFFYQSYNYGSLYHFLYFITESENEIKLLTFEIFTEKLCNQTQVVTLNVFDKISRKWKQNLKIPEKYSNFYNCTIVCGLVVNTVESHVNPVNDEVEGCTKCNESRRTKV